MPGVRPTPAERHRRRQHVAQLRAQGLTSRQIGARLGVDAATVCRDLRAVQSDPTYEVRTLLQQLNALTYEQRRQLAYMLLATIGIRPTVTRTEPRWRPAGFENL